MSYSASLNDCTQHMADCFEKMTLKLALIYC